MATPFTPADYQSVSPYLIVEDPDNLAAFLATVFGTTPLHRMLRPDGSVMHLEVRLDDSVVMIGGSTEGYPPDPCHVHFYVSDATTVYEAGLAAGGMDVRRPVQREPDDDLRAGFAYPSNVTWWIGTQL